MGIYQVVNDANDWAMKTMNNPLPIRAIAVSYHRQPRNRENSQQSAQTRYLNRNNLQESNIYG